MNPEETREPADVVGPPNPVTKTSDLPPVSPGSPESTRTGADDPSSDATGSHPPLNRWPSSLPGNAGTLPPPGYQITGELGRGGMGVVYAATDDRLKRDVALKMLLRSGDERGLVRFLIEAEAMARVRHPHVVQVFEAGEHAGQPYLALEHLSGGTLSEKLAKGRMPVREALRLMVKIARGVEAAHRQGIVHRDLKPGNVMFDAAGEPKVADFGLAKHGGKNLTATDAMMGTPAYMAPEQAKGETKTAGPSADVYSLGVMLYEMTTGARPFVGSSTAAIVYKVIHVHPEPPRRREPSLPRDVEIITLKCLEKDPGRRYADAGELADDLQRFLADKPITARPVGRVESGLKWVRRNPAVSGSLLVAASALLVGSVVSYLKYRDAKTQEGIANQKTIDERDRVRERDDALVKMGDALKKEGERVKERDDALEDANYQAGVGNMLLSAASYENRDVPLTLDYLAKVPANQRGWEWHYLLRQANGGIFTLFGHTGGITGVSFSPDGSRIVTGSADGTARVWNARTGTPLFVLKGHTGGVNGVSFSPDGTRIATGGDDETARVWDARTGAPLLKLKGPTGPAELQSVKFGHPVMMKVNSTPVMAVSFSPDGARIASGIANGAVQVWDARTGTSLLEFKGHTGGVTCLTFSPDGSRIATGGWDGVRVWDARTGTSLLEFQGHTGGVTGVSFSPDGARIATGGDDGTARVWDTATNPKKFPLLNIAPQQVSAGVKDDATGKELPSVQHPGRIGGGAFMADRHWGVHPDQGRGVLIIAQDWDATELEYRLIHTRSNNGHHLERFQDASKTGNSLVMRFHLDRLLSSPEWQDIKNFDLRDQLTNDCRLPLRAMFHTYSMTKSIHEQFAVEALAVNGDRMGQRLVAQQRIRDGKPAIAIPLLHVCMITRPLNAPPVEELLIAKAYLALNDRPQAERYYRAAVEWLDRPRTPMRVADVITKSAVNGWAALGDALKPVEDPRHNTFDWESWHECDVFRAEVEAALAASADRRLQASVSARRSVRSVIGLLASIHSSRTTLPGSPARPNSRDK